MPSLRTVAVLALLTLVCACERGAPTAGRAIEPSGALYERGGASARDNFALDFHQSFVSVPDAPSLDLTTTWSIEAWVYPRAAGNGVDQDFVSKWDGVLDAAYILQIDHSGRLRLVTNNGITQTIVLSHAFLANNEWQHVAGTFDGDAQTGTIRLYVNGVLDTVVTGALTPIPSTQPLAFGREGNYPGGTLDGIIDEIRLWNVARTESEIAHNWDRRLTGNQRGLVGLWRFNEGVGDVTLDESGNGNHGRLGLADGADSWDPTWTTNAAPVRR